MAGTENDQIQLWKNLSRLVDVFNFVGLTSASTALLLAYIRPFSTLFTLITFISFLLYLLTICDSLKWIFFTEFIFLIFMPFPYFTATLSFMLLLGGILLIVGVTSLSFVGVLFLWNKHFPGNVDFGFISAEIQMMTMELLVILFVNGYTMLFEWCINQEGMAWRITGVGLFIFLGFSSIFCWIFRLVYRWQEVHRAGARVSFVVTPTTEAAA